VGDGTIKATSQSELNLSAERLLEQSNGFPGKHPDCDVSGACEDSVVSVTRQLEFVPSRDAECKARTEFNLVRRAAKRLSMDWLEGWLSIKFSDEKKDVHRVRRPNGRVQQVCAVASPLERLVRLH
jgi:hypothetical protein